MKGHGLPHEFEIDVLSINNPDNRVLLLLVVVVVVVMTVTAATTTQ